MSWHLKCDICGHEMTVNRGVCEPKFIGSYHRIEFCGREEGERHRRDTCETCIGEIRYWATEKANERSGI